MKIRADIECACYGYEGIDAVKAALTSGLSLSTEELPIKINLIAPPLYGNKKSNRIFLCIIFNILFIVMTTSTPEKQDGLKALQDAIDKIEETIKSMGGVFQVQMAVSFHCKKSIGKFLNVLFFSRKL